ncbi:hypothetical protein BpHYR1_033410 [Brachionus plicatilis]|uniref:Uncharacterized protein n=1 Tax=Brachionus plicatilis TaxID=10195 RepID=A0A3M7PHY8_BRAPC|nr:hypothetical protein BpHYR1_033410 [Brachionus plicatilis]
MIPNTIFLYLIRVNNGQMSSDQHEFFRHHYHDSTFLKNPLCLDQTDFDSFIQYITSLHNGQIVVVIVKHIITVAFNLNNYSISTTMYSRIPQK